jgi:nitrogen fixation/metabolism regulation signal transduction histidine kinase
MLYKAKPVVKTHEIIQAVDSVVEDWNESKKGAVKKQVPKKLQEKFANQLGAAFIRMIQNQEKNQRKSIQKYLHEYKRRKEMKTNQLSREFIYDLRNLEAAENPDKQT